MGRLRPRQFASEFHSRIHQLLFWIALVPSSLRRGKTQHILAFLPYTWLKATTMRHAITAGRQTARDRIGTLMSTPSRGFSCATNLTSTAVAYCQVRNLKVVRGEVFRLWLVNEGKTDLAAIVLDPRPDFSGPGRERRSVEEGPSAQPGQYFIHIAFGQLDTDNSAVRIQRQIEDHCAGPVSDQVLLTKQSLPMSRHDFDPGLVISPEGG